ncbi:outer membrane protein [Paraglaciecola aestuariivivens]
MKNALTHITTYLIFTASLFVSQTMANTYVGVNYAKSDTVGYTDCPCPPDFELKAVKIDVDTPSIVFTLGYQFDNGVFVEGRHGRGNKKSGSTVSMASGFSFPGIDVKLDHFTYAGVGFEFMRDRALSPYISAGKMFNWILIGYDPATGTKVNDDHYQSLAYGAGVNWDLSENWLVNLDYQNYSRGKFGDSRGLDFETLSVGVRYQF